MGMRPLTVGAGVMIGMLVVLLPMIEDITDEVSTGVVDPVDEAANVALDEVALVVFDDPTRTDRRMATFDPDDRTSEAAEVFRKQSSESSPAAPG